MKLSFKIKSLFSNEKRAFPGKPERSRQEGSSIQIIAFVCLPAPLFKGMIFPRKGERQGG